MKKCNYIIVCLFFLASCASKKYKLSSELNEISGIDESFRDFYFSINDSGDEPYVYVLGHDGVLIHKMFVSGAKNIDWEDLSSQHDFLYIGDIGNNRNIRKDLAVYRIPVLKHWGWNHIDGKLNHNFPDTVKAERYPFNYPDQKKFPPELDNMNFDAEALTYADGKLLILSKDRSRPYNAQCKIYEANLLNSALDVKFSQEIQLKGFSWLFGSATSCDFLDNKLYILTYKRLYIYERMNGQFKLLRKKNLGHLQQWEGICVESEYEARIVAEKSRLGKQKMKYIKL